MTDTILLAVVGVGSVVGVFTWTGAERWRKRHRHGPWIIVGQRYSPPDRTVEISGSAIAVEDMARDVMYGYTMLTEQCGDPDCRLVRTRKLTGEVSTPLDAAIRGAREDLDAIGRRS